MAENPQQLASLSRNFSRRGWFALPFAVAAAVLLVLWQGAGEVAGVLGHAGWRLLLLGPLFTLALLVHAETWRTLWAAGSPRPARRNVIFADWVGLGVNWLLPVARVGGEIAKGALLADRSGDTPRSVASVVAHKTVQPMAIGLYTLLGIALLLQSPHGSGYGAAAAWFVGLLAVGLAGFVAAQRGGLFRLGGKLLERWRALSDKQLADKGEQVDRMLRAVYAARGRVAGALALALVYRFLLTLEVWLLLYWLGAPVGLVEALILDSLAQAVRAAAFFVPAGLGAQEGGFIALGLLLGIPTPVAASVSLARRVRELEVGGAALLAWQVRVGRKLREATPEASVQHV